ncbi:UDP-N-acetylmuramate dehydrogenase [Buchnera aphidicola (Macrosiphoniella sanborni)]|uniref:UDP-N-acetylenolpyruvoylglucosamine reductase n=1 Tax=Buchnera aphidicola (Macrosiphoniella sanborni) TaxID=1241865 RepID=A0A4D6YC41_9GAMM|nr:UDP-N-acetylmuramate dehydrogenase [Buchnera aphidicola]QCI23618.1 UDP-N-acetylmuramate dehydrogenase [Buchnera aphidicola (Macrosiphoniella sanborni)]
MYKKKCFYNQSLKNLNTFAIDVKAKQIVFVKTINNLIKISKKCKLYNIPYIILGEASNILFLKNYIGVVIFNRIKGIQITEQKNSWLIHVFSGEKWHNLVKLTLNLGIFGLENLALIPGRIGSAAIQNIGAYGLEFKDICEYVEILSLKNYKTIKIQKKFCQFSYRNSIFKSKYNHKYAVIKVGIKISKNWKPIIFSSLNNYIKKKNITAYQIFNIICQIRKNKLPDPKKTGNAGSFFKNPIVTKKKSQQLLSLYKNIPNCPQKNGLVKISAGWLIENYQFHNIQIGDASIYQKQKLILINKKNATSQDIITLARIIHSCILKKFHISLEPEIDFIGSFGKIYSSKFFNLKT